MQGLEKTAKLSQLHWDKTQFYSPIMLINQTHDAINSRSWNSKKFSPTWDKSAVIAAKSATVTVFLEKFSHCKHKLKPYLNDFQTSYNLRNIPLGNINAPNHMFQSTPVQWGFTLDEPRLTKGLAHFLNQSADACWLFLKSLFKMQRAHPETLEKQAVEFNDKERPSFSKSYSVTAEKPIKIGKSTKRIDLVICWTNSKKETHQVVIECKFDHTITEGQLPTYRNYIERHHPRDQKHYFVVAQRLDKHSAKKFYQAENRKHWRYVKWLPLLRYWEKCLTTQPQPDIEDFSRFRRTLWHKVTQS